MSRTSYEISNEELLNKLIQAASKVGESCNRSIIDVAGPSRWVYMKYLEGCMLARLDKVKPTIQPGDKVQVDEGNTIRGQGLDGHFYDIKTLNSGKYTVSRVWYINKKWFLELVGRGDEKTSLYPENQFIIKEKFQA